MKSLFNNSKAQTGVGAKFLIAIILFEMILWVFVYAANQDTTIDHFGNTGASTLNPDGTVTTTSDLSVTHVTGFFSGFNVAFAFQLPWWVNIFYVTFLAFMLFLGAYMLIRG